MSDNFEQPNNEQEPTIEPQKGKDDTGWRFVIFLAIFTFVAWIISLFKSQEKTRTPDKIQKEDVLKMFKVDKKTLGKWVAHFCDPSVLSYETYKKRRRLTGEEYFYLLSCLGLPTDETPVLSKAEIADAADSHTNTLRSCVIQNIYEFDFTIETYDALNIFPPAIAHQISEIFNRTIV